MYLTLARVRRTVPATVIALLALSGTAQAESLVSTTVSTGETLDRSCSARALSSERGVESRSVTAPALGLVQARLTAEGDGDWDLAVRDATTGATVAASAYRGSSEVAEGFVTRGQRLVVQACRRSGGVRTARLTVSSTSIDASDVEVASLVKVSTPTVARERELTRLGLDLTEHGGRGFVEVVLHGAGDAAKLREAGFSYVTRIADLGAESMRRRRADSRYAASVVRSGLPSGRTTYRRLFDYGEEMKALAADNPQLVKPITLPFETYEGRPVEGIEITEDVTARDGKPVFLQMGVHHAREWPSSEHAMEWAHELVNGYKAGDPRVAALVRSTRTIVVPVVNPDGFNTSREAGGITNGRGGPEELANIVAAPPGEYRRKNCRFADDSDGGSCLQPSFGLAEPGVDPNRNYGGFWGGPGASTDQTAQDYRGPGPFSEPETQNVRDLVSHRQVTTLITNHTFSNLVLRPPGLQSQGPPPDEPVYKALGDAMAAENGYVSQKSYELYDTTGTTEDWSYYATAGLGFTFEIGPAHFHPPFEDVVAEYEGTTEAAGGGGGNRAAYFLAQESTADAAKHSVLTGRAPAGTVLRLRKSFTTLTSPVIAPDGTVGEPQELQDTLDTTMQVPASGTFEWHVNPSTRPVVAESRGREPTGEPSPPLQFAGGPESTTPCADFDTEDETCWNDHPFVVPSGTGIDNAKATVRIQWPTIASDWDMKVFRDSNGDGSSAGETEVVGSSAQGLTDSESTTITEPVLSAGQFVVRVINYSAAEPYDGTVTFQGPDPFRPAQVESWTFTCESPEGTVLSSQQVTIDRGQRQALRLSGCSRRR